MEVLTANEAAGILKLHPFTVARLAREKKIPGFKVGGVWRFRKDRLERWVERETNGERRKKVRGPSRH